VAGAVDRLRAEREGSDIPPLVLAATDPAQPYGAAIPWPDNEGRPARAAGALVVLADGELLAYIERGAHKVLRFPAGREDDRWADALAGLVDAGRFRSLELRAIDGLGPHELGGDLQETLGRAGFQQGYK